MKKLTAVSPEQIQQLATYREKWIAIGCCTDPTNRQAAEKAIDLVYQCAQLPPPQTKVWFSNPFHGAIAAASIFDRSIRAQVWGKVRFQVRAKVVDEVRAQVWDQVWDQVGAQVRDQVWDQVRAQVMAQVGDQVWDEVWTAGYGLHDASWLSLYDYFQDVCGLHLSAINGLITLAHHTGWFWPFAHAVILTDRPSILNRDAQHRLHAEHGPALSYPDGWSIYAWHGVRVPAKVIVNPFDLTVQDIQQAPNVEVRRIMLMQYGEARYLLDVGAQRIQEDAYGALYRAEIPHDEPLMMVRVVNSTPEPTGESKVYWLRCPPHMTTAREAVAWSFGMTAEEYAPVVQT